jgi:hypothetical protein
MSVRINDSIFRGETENFISFNNIQNPNPNDENVAKEKWKKSELHGRKI